MLRQIFEHEIGYRERLAVIAVLFQGISIRLSTHPDLMQGKGSGVRAHHCRRISVLPDNDLPIFGRRSQPLQVADFGSFQFRLPSHATPLAFHDRSGFWLYEIDHVTIFVCRPEALIPDTLKRAIGLAQQFNQPGFRWGIIDGREAVQFLVTVKETLEDPARLLLRI